MKISSNYWFICVWIGYFSVVSQLARAEIADAAYRDGVFGTYVNHVGLICRYDNDSKIPYIIHSAGSSYNPNSVRVDNWNRFLDGNQFTALKAPANLSSNLRNIALNRAFDQLNANYWRVFSFDPCYKRPNSSPYSGDGCFRCDFLVEWVYEQIGYDICNDALLYAASPAYQRDIMYNAIQTPPQGVVMHNPSSTSSGSPTNMEHTNGSVTLRASAWDEHSGLAYSAPFEFYAAKWMNGAWVELGLIGKSESQGTRPFIMDRNIPYAFQVRAYDNGGNSAVSSVYYALAGQIYILNTNILPNGSGSINRNPSKSSYNNNEQVQLTANPTNGYVFSHWSGGVTGSNNPVTVTMNQDRTITANFVIQAPTYSLILYTSGAGSISHEPEKSTFNQNEEVTLTAKPGQGYRFSHWGGAVNGSDNPITVTMSKNRAIIAHFEPLPVSIFRSGKTTDLGNGFKWNSLGYLYDPYFPFVYSYSFDDWLYVVGSSEESFYFWVFKPAFWAWTGSSSFPYYNILTGPQAGSWMKVD